VPVRVDGWELLAWRDDVGRAEADVRITCGGGTYIRSLARDLARAVGSAAHLAALRRTASGPFRVDDTVPMARLRELAPADVPTRPPLEALAHLPVEALDPARVAQVVRGIGVPATVAGPRAALVDARTGVLVAAAERRGDEWQPRVVMRAA
jgi:tRNA pseudouridine55 synthase